MTPVHRTLRDDVLAFDLAVEMRTVRDELAAGRARIARTLVKEGPLRVTLIGLNPGGALHQHSAEAPITIHVLEGEIALDAGGSTRVLPAGSIAVLDGGIRHGVSSAPGGMLLLTLAGSPRGGDEPPAAATS